MILQAPKRSLRPRFAALVVGALCVACVPSAPLRPTVTSEQLSATPRRTDVPGDQVKTTETPVQVPTPTGLSSTAQLTYFAERNAGVATHVIYGAEISCLEETQPCLGVQQVLFQSDLSLNSYDWSPDGQQLAFSATVDGKGDIFVASLATGEITNITQTSSPTGETDPAWSPSGDYLAYEVCDGECNMAYSRPDGSQRTEIALPPHDATILSPRLFAWSPDGQSIGFLATGQDGFEQIWTLNLPTNGLSQLTSYVEVILSPSYIAHGTQIAFVRLTVPESGSPTGIYSKSLVTGSETTLVMSGSGDKLSLTWYENAELLAYTAAPAGQQYDLYLWLAASQNITQLTNTPDLSELEPKWRTVH